MKYFYRDLTLEVPDSCYYPREDSELLAEAVEGRQLKNKKCLDMGCGSGLLSIIMAKQGAAVTAADINPEAVAATRRNAAANGADVFAVYSDLFANVAEKFDLVAFNPPYLPGDEREKKDLTYYGGKDGRETTRKFLEQARKFLRRNGRILLLISTVTGEKEVADIALENGYSVRQLARKKVPWEELIVLELGLIHFRAGQARA